MSGERAMVLKMLRDGKISVEEAEALLEALGEEEAAGGAPQEERPEAGERAPEQDPTSGAAEAAFGRGAGTREASRGVGAWASLGRDIGEAVRQAMQEVGPSVREAMKRLREEMRGAGKVSASAFVQDLFGLASASDELRLSQPLAPGRRLLLRNPRGSVRIERSPDAQVRVEARRQVWSRDEEAARTLLDRVGVRLEPQDGDAVLEVGAEGGVRFRVDLTVRVPEGATVAADVSSGDVRADGLSGHLQVQIGSGDLHVGVHQGALQGSVKSGDVKIREAAECVLRALSGDVAAEAVHGNAEFHVASGDVRIGSVDGALVAEVLHGDLVAERVRGAARLKVMSGDAAVGKCLGDVEARVYSGDLALGLHGSRSVRAKTMSGDLEVRITSLAPGADVALEAVSGDVEAILAAGVGARIDATTRSGTVDWSVPAQVVQRSRTGVEAVVGSPDATLSIRAMSGDVRVREAS